MTFVTRVRKENGKKTNRTSRKKITIHD